MLGRVYYGVEIELTSYSNLPYTSDVKSVPNGLPAEDDERTTSPTEEIWVSSEYEEEEAEEGVFKALVGASNNIFSGSRSGTVRGSDGVVPAFDLEKRVEVVEMWCLRIEAERKRGRWLISAFLL